MTYAFFGTPEFAAIILEKLTTAGMLPAVVICNPDRPIERKQVVTPPPAKQSAQRHGIPVLQPGRLDHEFQSSLFALHDTYDFFVVAAYAKILPTHIIALPRLGTLGVHPSLLPAYRGATPIQSALLNGEQTTGTTLFMIDEKVDHGSIVSSVKCQVSDTDTYESLMRKLAQLSGELLIETLPKFTQGIITPKSQDETEATYTKKFATEDGFIPYYEVHVAQQEGNKTLATRIYNMIRALNPEPGVYTEKEGARVKLLAASLEHGILALTTIQYAGKKPRPLDPGEIL